MGGPMKRNTLFVFGNYEVYRQNLGITDVTLVPDAEARQGLLPDPVRADRAGATASRRESLRC